MSDAEYSLKNPNPLSLVRTELVWEGKYDEFGHRRNFDISANVLPLQKIETIDQPRSQAEATNDQTTLFKLDAQASKLGDFRNLLVWGDNKLVMASLIRRFKGSVRLIYIDPPFDVGADFSMRVDIGDENDIVEKEQSTLEMVAYRDMWGRGADSYLQMLSERLALMRELLTDDGTIYVHCDWRANSLLRLVMDEVFGAENFRNEIVWQKTRVSKAQTIGFGNVHDTILAFSKGSEPFFKPQFLQHPKEYQDSHYGLVEAQTGRRYGLWDFTQAGAGGSRKFGDLELKPPPSKHWIWKQDRIDEAFKEGRIVLTATGMPRLKRYLDESQGRQLSDIWSDIYDVNAVAEERLNYATQKPEALLRRIILIVK